MYEEKCLRGYDNTQDIHALAQRALQLCSLMITKFDTIRHKYWEYVAENFSMQIKEIPNLNVETERVSV